MSDTALILPDPKDVSLVEVRGRVIPAAAAYRLSLTGPADIPRARDLCRALEAYRKWVSDREGRDLIAAECRRTEVLIGKLLGPPEPTYPGKNASPAGEAFDVPREDRHKFRLMAANEEAVEKLLAEGRVARNLILEAIARPGPAVLEGGCTVDDLAALAARGVRFGCIYADPPWRYGNNATRGAAARHYKPGAATLSVEQLAALPVGELAAGNCHLHLWTTNAFLFECPRLFAAWGFEYQGVFVWCKPQMGLGNCWRVSHEFLLLATRGDARRFADNSLMSYLVADRGQHSAKPEQVRLMIEKASPGPYLELFGRPAVRGWTVWGNQISRDLFTQDIPHGETA